MNNYGRCTQQICLKCLMKANTISSRTEKSPSISTRSTDPTSKDRMKLLKKKDCREAYLMPVQPLCPWLVCMWPMNAAVIPFP
ncbi:hypothetical protein AB205_0207350 [Aquarana catesbeiana]|uniref:Uncharacterized protein n=1 Tax=Aquarana catesbeiana TaxID=8400 RepID=A0A2G9S6Q5_AQUCT|nr:hypothetical protein AB205_0207350 [Aquarana catesbeiana]